MKRFEYLFISCDYHNKEWRPRHINGQELPDWKRGPIISEFSNQIGAEGWELVNLMTGQRPSGAPLYYRLVFKREYP